jgi:uncharacterized FlaG/YvyC family protein
MSIDIRSQVNNRIDKPSPVSESNLRNADSEQKPAHQDIIRQRHLHYRLSPESNEIIIEVIDKASNEVIRTIPEEQINQLVNEFMQNKGLLINTKS